MEKKYTTIDLFAGIGGMRLGFEAHGCVNVFSSEIDAHARKMYERNFGECPFGDINDIQPQDVPDHDILLAGFPCQAFSIAGKGLGFADTRGTLFFNIERILAAKKPKAFLLENVKRLTTHNHGNTMRIIVRSLKALGYTVYYKVLNSLHYGLPQKRERVYIVGFKEFLDFSYPRYWGRHLMLSDILEPNDRVARSYFLSDKVREKKHAALKKQPVYPSVWHENLGGNISPLPYSCALRAGGSYNYLTVNGIRRLTGREMLRLQGFPDHFAINVPYTQCRKFAGNSVSVPVIKTIANAIIKTLDEQPMATYQEQLFKVAI